jgi:histidinol-phosphate aminotransferase
VKNFDPKDLCFYTRIYDQGKKSVISVRLSEIYGVPEERVLLAYGGEEILKNAIHYFLMEGDNKTILIPEFSWWYYNRVASECGGTFEMYPLHELDDTFAYHIDEVIEYTNRIHPRMLLLASPNNPTGNSLTSEEIGRIMENIPSDTMVLVDEAYASFITSDTDYIAPLVNKYHNLIISRTLSKFYGLPGLRCGFGFIGEGHEQFLSYSNKYLGFNRFSEAVALAALDSDEHYRHVADDMEWGRQLYKKELGPLPGFKVYKSVANFILIKYPIEIKEALMEALKLQDYKINNSPQGISGDLVEMRLMHDAFVLGSHRDGIAICAAAASIVANPTVAWSSYVATITSTTAGAAIYYTDDGSDPRCSNTRKLYDSSSKPTYSATNTPAIRVAAVKDGLFDSQSVDTVPAAS